MPSDILINNIAWVLRHLPVFGVFGDGRYKLQPIYVDDLAELAVRCAGDSTNRIVQAIGPETFTYRELVKATGTIIGCPRAILSVNPEVGYLFAAVAGKVVHDIIITRDEIRGLMEDRLVVHAPAAGKTRESGVNFLDQRSRITNQKRRTSNDLIIAHYSLAIERSAGAHGNTRIVTDATGKVVEDMNYDGFANTLGFNAATELPTYLYNSMPFDAASGNYYDHARYFDTGTGSFTQADYGYSGSQANPMADLPYAFTGGDPNSSSNLNGHAFTIAGTLSAIADLASLVAIRISTYPLAIGAASRVAMAMTFIRFASDPQAAQRFL